VLELIREERTVSEVAAEYDVHPTQLQRWKAEALKKLPQLFAKDSNEVEKLKKKHDKEKDELTSKSVQLSVEANWLKKNLASNRTLSERKRW